MTHSELIIYDNSAQLAAAAAERICQAAAESIAAQAAFTLCLTGGSTPERTSQLLARRQGVNRIRHAPRDAMPHAEREEYGQQREERGEYDFWSHTFLFFGDERFVPQDDDSSDYQMVRHVLLQEAPVPADHVFAVPTQKPVRNKRPRSVLPR